MHATNDASAQPSPGEQVQRYRALAEQAIRHYPLGPTTLTFVQHNAGVVYRVLARERGQVYLLKLYDRIGAGANPPAEQIEAGLRWLAALARDTALVVQTPVMASTSQFVTQVALDDSVPINCTVQQWVEGEPLNGHFTAGQMRRVGALMATLHQHSQRNPLPQDAPALRHDDVALERNVAILRATLDATVLSSRECAVLVAARERIVALMAHLGTDPVVWGPVHGDLHHGNLLFDHGVIHPIDFGLLRLAHYAYDMGVTLYHIFYQAPTIRRAFFEGYRSIRPLPEAYSRYVEAFVTYAAIDNIAWNSTNPDQVASTLFRRNVRQLIAAFCAHLAADRPFLFS